MNKRKVESWKRQIQKRMSEVAKVRDAIRDDVTEMEALGDCCERAYDEMERACEALSELT